MRKLLFVGLLFVGLLFVSSTVYADYRRINIDLAFQEPLPKEVEILLDQLNVVLKQLKPYAGNVTTHEETTKTHVCKHDVEGACVEEKELTNEVFVKPTPSPK